MQNESNDERTIRLKQAEEIRWALGEYLDALDNYLSKENNLNEALQKWTHGSDQSVFQVDGDFYLLHLEEETGKLKSVSPIRIH